jgi:hypothetical protein
MGQSSLLGAERTAPKPKGHDTEALGPSDSSDSGSDMAGLEDPEVADPTLPVDVALRDDSPHALLGSENLGGFASDVAGTGERRSAGSDAGASDAHDIGVDRVFVAGATGEEDPPDDEDPDLAFIDEIQAQDLVESADDVVEEAEEGEEDEGEHSAMRAGALPIPPQPNPAPDEPEAPERPDKPDDDADDSGRPIPALLRRQR